MIFGASHIFCKAAAVTNPTLKTKVLTWHCSGRFLLASNTPLIAIHSRGNAKKPAARMPNLSSRNSTHPPGSFAQTGSYHDLMLRISGSLELRSSKSATLITACFPWERRRGYPHSRVSLSAPGAEKANKSRASHSRYSWHASACRGEHEGGKQ